MSIDHEVILNANVITMAAADARCRALAIEHGKIIRIGNAQDMQGLIEAGWPQTDLKGQTVLPGFIDSHQHLMLSGSQDTAVHLNDVSDIEALLDKLADAAASIEPGGWVRGSYLNEQHLAEKRMPTAAELDRMAPNHPTLVMHATCHLCSLNSAAMAMVQPPKRLDGMDMAGNRPTGVFRDPCILTCIHPALGRLIPKSDKIGFLKHAARMALNAGITTAHALDGGDLGPGDTAVIFNNRQQLPISVVCYNQSMDLGEVEALGLPRVGGCICADGAFEAHTAALFEPYADEPDNYGALTYTQAEMDAFILAANRAGLQIAVHCESERSIEQVLWAMEKALRDCPRHDHRHRIEHLELPTEYQIERMARAGIMASMQPAFIPAFIGQTDMALYETLLGNTRLARVHPYRTLLDAGIPISGGSDSPVTPYHPLAGVQAAVNHPNLAQRVSLYEALQMFTTTAAWSAFEEKEKGSIAPGKRADLVALAQDPFNTPQTAIADIDITGVCVAGCWHEVDETR